jgi:hypothetical protein
MYRTFAAGVTRNTLSNGLHILQWRPYAYALGVLYPLVEEIHYC